MSTNDQGTLFTVVMDTVTPGPTFPGERRQDRAARLYRDQLTERAFRTFAEGATEEET